jgi:hypothetical protein
MSRFVKAAATAAAGVLLVAAPPAEAGLLRGLQYIVMGVLQVPLSTIAGTFNGLPIAGTAFGLVNGVLTGASMVGMGTLEVAGAGVNAAKAAATYLLPFLF